MRWSVRRSVVALVALVAPVAATAFLAGGCGDSGPGSAATTTTAVERIVALGPADLERVTVAAGDRSADVDLDAHERVAPLLAARAFEPVEPLASYGLDAPQARLVYQPVSGRTVVVSVGGRTVDDTFFYVRRHGDPRIFLAVADVLTPVLTLLDPGRST